MVILFLCGFLVLSWSIQYLVVDEKQLLPKTKKEKPKAECPPLLLPILCLLSHESPEERSSRLDCLQEAEELRGPGELKAGMEWVRWGQESWERSMGEESEW
jgi:hypothetical protein